MHPSLLLGAGLILGQAPVITEVQVVPGSYKGPYPAPVRQASAHESLRYGSWQSSGWQEVGPGWNWKGETVQTGWFQEKSIFGRIQDRIGSIFGRKETPPQQNPAGPMPADVQWHPMVGPGQKARLPQGVVSPNEFPGQEIDPTSPRVFTPGQQEPPPLTLEVAPSEVVPMVNPGADPAPRIETPGVAKEGASTAPASRRIPLTPDGSFTIELVEPQGQAPQSQPPQAKVPQTQPTAPVEPVRFQQQKNSTRDAADPQEPGLGHAPDFTWIDGRLELENGRLMIRYASAAQADRFGGRMPLGYTGNLPVRIGESVRVRGEIVQTTGEPIYMVADIAPLLPPR